jgi:hypothetical protein
MIYSSSQHRPMTSIIAGAAVLQNRPQLIGLPSRSAIAVPTTLAEAPKVNWK